MQDDKKLLDEALDPDLKDDDNLLLMSSENMSNLDLSHRLSNLDHMSNLDLSHRHSNLDEEDKVPLMTEISTLKKVNKNLFMSLT